MLKMLNESKEKCLVKIYFKDEISRIINGADEMPDKKKVSETLRVTK